MKDLEILARSIPCGLQEVRRTDRPLFIDSSPAEGLRRIFLNALSLLFAYALPKVFTLGAVVVAARVLGTGEFGAYGTAAALAVILSVVSTLGMMPLLIRDIAREPDRAPELVRSAHLLKTIANGVMLVILVVVAKWLLAYPDPVVATVLLLGVSYAIGSYAENMAAYFQAMERMHVWMQASAAFGLVTGGLGAALVWTTSSMVWFALAPIAGQAAALFWLVRQAPRTDPSGRVGAVVRGEESRPGDGTVRSRLRGSHHLLQDRCPPPGRIGARRPTWALYTAAYKFWDVAQALSLVAIAAVYPRLSRVAPRNGTGERWAGTRVTELMLLAVVPACALLWLLKGPLIETLYGASYVDATPVLGRLSPALPALAVNLLAAYILGAAGKMTHVAMIYAIGVVANVVLNVFLVTSMGPLGAATAKLGSEVLLAGGFLVILRMQAAVAPTVHALVIAVAAGGLAWVVTWIPDTTGGLVQAPVYAAAVALLYWRGRVMPGREWLIVREAAQLGDGAGKGREPRAESVT